MENILKSWEFRQELMDLAERCTKIKGSTAKRKMRSLLNKYEDLVMNSTNSLKYYQDELSKLQKINSILKKGVIKYDGGVLLIKNIAQIQIKTNQIKTNQVVITTLNGRDIYFNIECKYLLELFI